MHVLKASLPYIAPFLLIAAIALGEKVKPEATHTLITPGKVAIEWAFHDETRVWLEVRNFNSRDFPGEGYHPSYTEIVVKPEYKPRLRKLPDGRWAISFMSEIAQDLP